MKFQSSKLTFKIIANKNVLFLISNYFEKYRFALKRVYYLLLLDGKYAFVKLLIFNFLSN